MYGFWKFRASGSALQKALHEALENILPGVSVISADRNNQAARVLPYSPFTSIIP